VCAVKLWLGVNIECGFCMNWCANKVCLQHCVFVVGGVWILEEGVACPWCFCGYNFVAGYSLSLVFFVCGVTAGFWVCRVQNMCGVDVVLVLRLLWCVLDMCG